MTDEYKKIQDEEIQQQLRILRQRQAQTHDSSKDADNTTRDTKVYLTIGKDGEPLRDCDGGLAVYDNYSTAADAGGGVMLVVEGELLWNYLPVRGIYE